jgi:hypothetical protein
VHKEPQSKSRYWIIRIALLFSAVLLAVFTQKKFPEKASLTPKTHNGHIIMVSNQKPDIRPIAHVAPPPRMPAQAVTTPSPLQRTEVALSSRPVSRKPDLKKMTPVKVNGLNLYWLKQKFAVKKSGAKQKQTANGFEIINQPDSQIPFGEIDNHKFQVVSDANGIINKIITGMIVIEFKEKKDSLFITEWAKDQQLELSYSAPHIKTAILKVPPGKNIIAIQKALAKDPAVRSAKLELLGPGVTAK